MPKVEATDKQEFKPLDAGEYLFVIVKASDEIGEKPPHNPYVHVQLQEPVSKCNVFENLVFSEKSAWRITNFWRALGNNVKKGDSIEFEASDVIGREVKAQVSIGEDNKGRPSNDVDYFIEPDESEMRKASTPPPSSKAVKPF